ncbi:MAG: amino acid permease [Chloroflexaceae bacterium]|nr:amino acid permease [Chloroflexaceae bacterium]
MQTEQTIATGCTAAPTPQLKRSLGLWMATALVIGNMIGSGVFLLPASLAGAAGPVSIIAWGVTGLGALLLAAVFANLGRAYPRTGGPYAYARQAFGDFIGFQTAWGYWIAVWAGNAAIAVAFVGYLAVFWPALATNNLLAACVAIAAIWLLTLANIVGVRQGGMIQLITTILKFVPLALIGIVGIFFINPANFTPFAPQGLWQGINAGTALTLWAFIGLESATIPAEEVHDAERTIPRATFIGTTVTVIIYIITTVAIMGIVPNASLATSSSPFADAAAIIFNGQWAAQLVAIVAMISAFGCLNGWILLQGRVPLAAAEDGLFPQRFARLHPRWNTPVFGLVVSSLLITILMLMNYSQTLVEQFNFVILLATLTTLVPYAYAAAAEVFLFINERDRFSGRRFLRDSVIAALAFVYAIYAIIGAGTDVIAKGFLLLLAGIPVYLYLQWNKRRDQLAATTPTSPPAPAVQPQPVAR